MVNISKKDICLECLLERIKEHLRGLINRKRVGFRSETYYPRITHIGLVWNSIQSLDLHFTYSSSIPR